MPGHRMRTFLARRLSGFRIVQASLLCLATGYASATLQELPVIQAGDGEWVLSEGVYEGNFSVSRSLHVRCLPGAVIDAGGQGHGLRLMAPDITVRDCEVRNWGRNLTNLDAGIFIERQASGAVVENVRLSGPGFGVWVDATPNVILRGAKIRGDVSVRSQDRGNGIHLFAVTGALVENNEVSQTRDGIYIDTSNNNTLTNNFLHDLRYGVHYMYSHHNAVLNNCTLRTRTGYALMQSRNLTVEGNYSEQDQNYGILMNYITYSTLRNNQVVGVKQGEMAGVGVDGAEGKALFVYNSPFNVFERNRFEQSDIGIHLTAGSEDNQVSGNAFIHNRRQVKYVATRLQEWSTNRAGNFWSDYLGWDRNADGIGDVPYEPNDNVDRLLWTYPQARLLLHSPSIDLLRWAQQAFPVVKSPGVRDSAPLMRDTTQHRTQAACRQQSRGK
ncbi:nitrous oxide reductase family maturation protein NosD [Hahella aquimaris]|uniref:nitrous oxide reductase family maturation protein NosD n=1 Tax=Hahella sp. HNIBRBA332 TaxID=3015983 RepID=UPI00273B036F|nr:nitrous oxide reductase family maturation protein NosD [Hahella sp. HNIBRBA332]WLQ16311.1 nitrous oxide reductase family maturation protein NosD [Hahella sp. HNIBRBA332]